MIGPEFVAQQKKFVRTRMMNWGERSAWFSDIGASPDASGAAGAACNARGRRTRKKVRDITGATTPSMTTSEVRQSLRLTSQAAKGDIVIGAMPKPADTSDTARLRFVSNQP